MEVQELINTDKVVQPFLARKSTSTETMYLDMSSNRVEYAEGRFSVFLGSLVKEPWKLHLDQETKKHLVLWISGVSVRPELS